MAEPRSDDDLSDSDEDYDVATDSDNDPASDQFALSDSNESGSDSEEDGSESGESGSESDESASDSEGAAPSLSSSEHPNLKSAWHNLPTND